MPWVLLVIAGLFEVAWALTLKATEQWTKPGASIATLVLMGISFFLLARAMRDIPAGTAYAVWTGIGTIGVAILGIVVYREPSSAARVVFLGLIVAGIVGLKLTTPTATPSATPTPTTTAP